MADLNKETKAVLGSAANKIGTYQESTGGGDPLRKGEKFKVADSPEEAEKMREQDPNTKVRVSQPRNEDGTFGYNSQNARKLKYGPSRGKTVPDFLRGVDLSFIEKGTSLVMLGEKGIEYYISTIDMTKEQLIENCKHYIEDTKGFAGLHEGMMEKKKGRHSKAELRQGEKLEEFEKDTKDLEEGKMSGGAYEAKYRFGTPMGIVAGKKVDISQLAEKTQAGIAKSQEEYGKIEESLKGIDATMPGMLGSWGTVAYNKAGATEEEVKAREDWRESLKQGNIKKVSGGSATPIDQKEAETVPSTYGKKSNFKFSGDSSARKKAGDDILKELGIGVG